MSCPSAKGYHAVIARMQDQGRNLNLAEEVDHIDVPAGF